MAKKMRVYTAVVEGEEEDPENATGAIASYLVETFEEMGWRAEHRKLDGDLRAVLADLKANPPDFIFNMVEAYCGTDRLAFIGTGLFEASGIPFAGSGTFGIMAGTDKLVCKRILQQEGVPVAGYAVGPDWSALKDDRLYIVKAIAEHASLGLDQGAICQGRAAVEARAEAYLAKHGSRVFAEEFIKGREFNVGMVEFEDGPRVMPLAEMDFTGFPDDLHRIVTYDAKWKEGSVEYDNSNRRFINEFQEEELAGKLRAIALKVWKIFDLCGWARVDFRVDQNGEPFVIDVNVNPDITEEAGLAAAAYQSGLEYPNLLNLIIDAGMRRRRI